jgi:hypothetical protein
MNAQTFPRRFHSVPDAVAALLLADDAFAERAAHLLAAYMDAAFHADAVLATGATSPMWGEHYTQAASDALAKAKRALVDAMDDMRLTVATERGLWNGVDPSDIDMVTTRKLIAEHAQGRVPYGRVSS